MSRAIRRLSGLMGVLALCAPALAAEGFQEALPAGTLAFVGVDDLAEFKQDFGESAWGKLLADSAFDPARKFVADQLAEIAKEAESKLGSDPFQLLELVDGPVGLALLDFAAAEGGGEPNAAIALLLGVGEKGEEMLLRLDRIFEVGVKEGKLVRQTEEAGDVEVRVLLEGKGTNALRYGLAGDTLVLTLEDGDLKDKAWFATLVDGAAGELDATLADADKFASSAAGEADEGVRVYVDFPVLLERGLALGASEDDRKMVAELGLNDFGPIGASARFGADGAFIDVVWPFGGQGYVPRLAQALFGPGTFATPALVPEKPQSYYGMRLDLLAGLEVVQEMVEALAPAEEKAQFKAMLEAMDAPQEGFDVRKDILENLAGEIAGYMAPVQDESEAMPGTEEKPASMVVLLPVRDGARLETAIDALMRENGLHAARKREEFQGHTTYSLPIVFFNVRYAVLPDLLVVSLSKELLNDTLRRYGATGLPTLASSDEFKELVEKVGGPQASVIAVNDSAAFVEGMFVGFETVREQMRMLPAGPGKPNLPDIDFPDASVIEKYFQGSSVGTYLLGEAGFEMHSAGP